MVSDYEHEVDDAFEHIEDGMHWIAHGQQLEGEEHAVLLTLLALVDQLILLVDDFIQLMIKLEQLLGKISCHLGYYLVTICNRNLYRSVNASNHNTVLIYSIMVRRQVRVPALKR